MLRLGDGGTREPRVVKGTTTRNDTRWFSGGVKQPKKRQTRNVHSENCSEPVEGLEEPDDNKSTSTCKTTSSRGCFQWHQT